MIITRVNLHNFRQYRGRHDVSFASDKERNVTTVTGPNGAGKTGVFLALNWCLYGADDERGNLLSKGLTDKISGSVEVHFLDRGSRFVARRELVLRDGMEVSGDLELVKLSADGSPRPISNPSLRINTILPADARRYFFFDAERIDEMSRPGHESDVAEAVKAVMKMEVLERAVRHLRQAEKEYGKKVVADQEITGEARRLTGTIESHESQLGSQRAELDLVKEDEETLARDLTTVKTQLAELHEVTTHIRREAEITRKLGVIEGPRAERLAAMRERVTALVPAVAGRALDSATQRLDDARRDEHHVGMYVHQIDDVLEGGTCVCGRPVDSASAEHLQAERARALGQPDRTHIVRLSEQLVSLGSTRADRVADVREELASLADLRSQQSELHRELEELRATLARHPSTDIKQLERERNRIEQERRVKAGRRGSLEQLIVDSEGKLKGLRKELQRTARDDSAQARLTRTYELASRSAAVAAAMLDEYRADTRRRLEKETNEIFAEMIWKQGHFERVHITERYALDVVDRYGESALSELSAGERQVLSLSFILAMARVAGDEAPIVIDTPFGQISDAPLQNIAAALPRLADQVVLLLTDRELSDAAAKAIEPHLGRSYELRFDQATGQTTPVETTEVTA